MSRQCGVLAPVLYRNLQRLNFVVRPVGITLALKFHAFCLRRVELVAHGRVVE